MEKLITILWITGIWFFVWVVMYLFGEMVIDVNHFNVEKTKKLKKYVILLTITIIGFYITQIIDYLNIFN